MSREHLLAEALPGAVAGQAVVAATLDVERGQVSAQLSGLLGEELGSEDRVEELVHRVGDVHHQPSGNVVCPTTLKVGNRVEECPGEGQVTNGRCSEVLVQPEELVAYQAVAEAICSGCKRIRDGGIDKRVVATVLRHLGVYVVSKYGGEEFIVGDLLHLCGHDLPGLLVEPLVVPAGVNSGQIPCDAVVFPQPQRVHDCQSRLLVGALISSDEEGQHPTLRPLLLEREVALV